ncbi:MAG: M20/M25/M40 family metallo-hydrolase [Tannerella sp.]|jgi:hypothetical protein|nr:M20/M25/M40 family metallo-hydrolase [Tannerella sp.]
MYKRFSLIVGSLFIILAAGAQTRLPDEIAYRIKGEAFSNSKVEEMSQWLTDFLGPRLTASKNGFRAEELMQEKMTQMGLSNARREFAIKFARGGWNNEKTYIAMTKPYYCSFTSSPVAWSGGTNGLVEGDVVLLNVKTEKDIDSYRGKLSGKIVLMPGDTSYTIRFEPLAARLTDEQLEELAQDPRGDGANNMYRMRPPGMDMGLREKLNQLLKDEKPLAVLNSSGTFNVPMSRGLAYNAGDPYPTPEINLPLEDHGRMIRLLTHNTPVRMELDIKNVFYPTDTLVNNVIAEIPGTDPKLKSEIVMIGAHFDSWHGGTGGADNGSGCIVMLEAMRIIKELGIQPKRTIRIALWGGEEQGLFGSRGYAANNLYDIKSGTKLAGFDKFVLYLNMDNGSGRFRGIYLEENDMAVPFFKTWMVPFESLGFKVLSLRRTGSTDHVSFNMLGLPAYQFIQDRLEYGRTYHTLMDTYERLSFDDLRVNAALVAWFALNAAQDNARIPYKPDALDKLMSNIPAYMR